MSQTRKRICPICEAACGLVVETDGRLVRAVRGNPADTFSSGHVCPKGVALAELDADPDRLRTPLVRRNGKHVPASWDEAMGIVAERLAAVRKQHGNDAVAMYLGNPSAHNIGLATGFGVLARALGSRNLFTAGSVDQLPKQLATALMFGNDRAIAVPDIVRADLLLILGANPIVSNGSLWVVPDIRGKVNALKQRGGALIVVDPRQTETARLADSHLAIRPGTDAWLLAALVNEVSAAGRIPSPRLAARMRGFDELKERLASVTPERAARHTGIAAAEIRTLATRLAAAERPVVYGRVGTTLQRFGTLTSFLIDVLNIQLDALDRPGGAMFPEQPFATPAQPAGRLPYARWRSRVSGYPELVGQLPVACFAEEMETPGPGQIRALVTIAGNPVASNPESARLERAIAGLDFVVSVDIYLTETSRLADVVLPGTSPFEDGHYDSFLGAMTWRNTARYSAPLFPVTDRPDEWRVMLGLSAAATLGRVATAGELDAFEDEVVAQSVREYVSDTTGPLAGRDVQEIVAAIGPERGVERLLDLGIRAGRWGDAFGARGGDATSPALTLARMIDSPDSIDLGALQPSLDRVVRTSDGLLNLAPQPILDEITRLLATPDAAGPGELLLIGRRNIQTNNSWLHNLPLLARGPARCVLEMHPVDATTRGLADGDLVSVQSRVDAIVVPLRVTDTIAPGVVCLPHGFSAGGTPEQRVATARAAATTSASSNRLAPADEFDVPSVTTALNGIPVVCARVPRASRAP
jgi:anaerobic selenocysteine-containing dehydrogenase